MDVVLMLCLYLCDTKTTKSKFSVNVLKFLFKVINSRNCRLQMLYKIGFFKNFGRFTGKHLYRSLFFNKVTRPVTLSKKKQTLVQMFSRECYEIFSRTPLGNSFWKNQHYLPQNTIYLANHSMTVVMNFAKFLKILDCTSIKYPELGILGFSKTGSLYCDKASLVE